MTLWQIGQFRAGWLQANTMPLTDEEKAKAELESITDDEFFAGLAVDDNGPTIEISEEEFFGVVKEPETGVERIKPSDFFKN
nr:hypothetical protein [Brevundimonas naejangsanensis]